MTDHRDDDLEQHEQYIEQISTKHRTAVESSDGGMSQMSKNAWGQAHGSSTSALCNNGAIKLEHVSGDSGYIHALESSSIKQSTHHVRTVSV